MHLPPEHGGDAADVLVTATIRPGTTASRAIAKPLRCLACTPPGFTVTVSLRETVRRHTVGEHIVDGANDLKQHGHCAFAEFPDVWAMQEDFARAIAATFDKMVETATQPAETEATT